MENDKKWTQIFINNDIRRALIDGDEVYSYLREKYPESNNINLDNIVNALCASLIILIKNNVDKSDYKEILQMIWRMLNENL